MSNPRRLLGTGPLPSHEEQARTERRTAVERLAAAEAPDSHLPQEIPTPTPSGRRPLGTGPSAADF
ncbi:hypothetical protein ACWCQL_13135 [Streptomyces sp. NPDC002073]